MNDLTRQNKIRNFVQMNQRPYTTTLTISLLVSNSIKTIRNCMESLQPLLYQVPSELIVVDTVGPENSDGSLAIAEKYADKVVHFKWCDDFAAARNAGLKEAHGKWFMFIDDDEWFDDVSELVEFFNNENEQNKYFSLAYNFHNYYDSTGTNFKLTKSNRCSRLWNYSHFSGKVHEFLDPTYSPTKYVTSFVHHYGYAKEVGKNKFKRNDKLLKSIVSKSHQDMHSWAQLIAGYDRDTSKNREKITYFAELALRNFQKINNPKENEQTFAAAILGYWLQSASLDKNWHQVINLAKNYLKIMFLRNYDLCMIDYFVFNALIQLNSKDNLKTIFNEYLMNFNMLKDNEENLLQQYTPFLSYTVSYTKLANMTSTVLSHLIEVKDWNECSNLINQLPLSSNLDNFSQVLLTICQISFKNNNPTILADVWRKINDKESNCLKLGEIFNSYKLSLTLEDETKFMELLTRTNINHPYFKLQQAELYNENTNEREQLTERLANNKIICSSPYEELFILLVTCKKDPSSVVLSLDFNELNSLVNYINTFFLKRIKSIPNFVNKMEKCYPQCPQRDLLCMNLRQTYLFSNQILLTDIYREIDNYVCDSLNFAHKIYNVENFQLNLNNLLPANFKFAYYLHSALSSKKMQNEVNYLKNLNLALKAYPKGNLLIKKLIFNFDNKLKKVKHNQQEFNQLAAQIKIKIRALIAADQKQVALPLLKSLVEIVPNDSEATDLLHQITK
ncbi:MAG: glycosyltransferase [Liquorilactobacillus nagelii]|uniref:Glycosyltransferase 2-like domain-containing protein n=2 Tax=Lactobacillaceae TaxID=33958 RepID=A0A3S6QY32_9LACO|nr:glycosyltransferase [Liquorilactobacillus nagelii]AUJ33014.1 hypothetical protein BSQ50_10945 [Liquorilactobacillus nagelii]MCC7616620.1 hypothetical protein [Liquorilactobacillus nagelii]MCP9315255.1 glycosyltransferase [Liquorilactobacillus nagelii]